MATEVAPSTDSGNGNGEARTTTPQDFSHLLVEFESQDELLKPIKHSARIKYSALDVSKEHIALGASTGSVYIFQRDNLKYILQLSGNNGSISKLRFSRRCDRLAVVTWDSLIVVWKLNIEERKNPVQILTSTTHKDAGITCLAWDESGNRVFAGDERGWVTITNVDSKKPSGLFKLLSQVILKADSQIVQLDFVNDDLLVSTLTRIHVCFTKRKKCTTIGKKLREGFFGACFYRSSNAGREAVVLSARPGSRIWEANTSGEVLKTHQFKKLLAVPPLPVVSLQSKFPSFLPEFPSTAQSLIFSKLWMISDHFILALAASGIYILDLANVQVILWTDSIKDVLSVALFRKDIYCLHSDQQIRKYSLCGIARCAAKLFRRNRLTESLQICLTFQTCIKRKISRTHLSVQSMRSMLQRLEESNEPDDSVKTFREMLSELELTQGDTVSMASSHGSNDSGDVVRLESGIHVIRRRNPSENSDEGHILVTGAESCNQGQDLKQAASEDISRVVVSEFGANDDDEMDGDSVMTTDAVHKMEDERPPEARHHNTEDVDRTVHNVLLSLESQSSKPSVEVIGQRSPEVIGQKSPEVRNDMEMRHDGTEDVDKVRDSETVPSKGQSSGHSTVTEGQMSPEVSSDTDMTHEDTDPALADETADNGVSSLKVCTTQEEELRGLARGESIGSCASHVTHEKNAAINCKVTRNTENVTNDKANISSDEKEEKDKMKNLVQSGNSADDNSCTDSTLQTDKPVCERDGSSTFDLPNPQETESQGILETTTMQHELNDTPEELSPLDDLSTEQTSLCDSRDPQAGMDSTIAVKNTFCSGAIYEEKIVNCEENILRPRSENLASEPAENGDKGEVAVVGTDVKRDETILRTDVAGGTDVAMGESERQRDDEDVFISEPAGVKRESTPDVVPVDSPVQEQDVLSSSGKDTKAVVLKEKRKKLKKSRRESRIVEIGTVKGPKTSPSKPIPTSPAPSTSPSKTSSTLKGSSPHFFPSSFKQSPSKEIDVNFAPKHREFSPPRNNVTEGEENIKNTHHTPDGLLKMGNSFKNVTRSLSQKLNKTSPLKRLRSSDGSSSSPHQREDKFPAVTISPHSTQLKLLEEATETARFQLNDSSICFDSHVAKVTLEIWLKVMKEVLKTVTENHLRNQERLTEGQSDRESLEVHSPRYQGTNNPPLTTLSAIQSLQMSEDLLMDCQELAVNCFEFQVFGARDENQLRKESDLDKSQICHVDGIDDDDRRRIDLKNADDILNCGHGLTLGRTDDERSLIVRNLPVVENQSNISDTITRSSREKSFKSDIYETIRPREKNPETLPKTNRDGLIQEPPPTTPHAVTLAIQQERDRQASHFVWQFYPMLDALKVRDVIDKWVVKEKTFQRLLEAEEATSEDQVWTKIQDMKQETMDDVVREVKDVLREKPVLTLACLKRIQALPTVKVDMSNILHQCYPYIRFWEAIHLLKDTEHYKDKIMSYVTMVMNIVHKGSRTSFFVNDLKDVSLRGFLLSVTLAQSHPPRSKLECTACKTEPIPMSHSLWSKQDIIENILNNSKPEEYLQDMLNDCYRYGYWSGVIKLHKVKGQRKAALSLVLKLADLSLLDETTGIYPQSFIEWHQVLGFLQSFSSVLQTSLTSECLCLDCQKKSSERIDTATSSTGIASREVSCDPRDTYSKLIMEENYTKVLFQEEVQSGDKSHENKVCHSACSTTNNNPDVSCTEGFAIHESANRHEASRQGGEEFKPTFCTDSTDESHDQILASGDSSPDRTIRPKLLFSWEHIAGLLLGSVGPGHTLKVLQAYDIPNGALTAEFFRKCLQRASVDAKESTSKGQEGERVREPHRRTVHPLLNEYLEAEMAQMPSLPVETDRWFPAHSQEYHKIHWGRSVNLNSDCQMCGWSLQSFKSNLYVYPCGHIYHRDCSSGEACIICKT